MHLISHHVDWGQRSFCGRLRRLGSDLTFVGQQWTADVVGRVTEKHEEVTCWYCLDWIGPRRKRG